MTLLLMLFVFMLAIAVGNELARFRVQFEESSLSKYDSDNMVETIGRMHDTLREISIHTSP